MDSHRIGNLPSEVAARNVMPMKTVNWNGKYKNTVSSSLGRCFDREVLDANTKNNVLEVILNNLSQEWILLHLIYKAYRQMGRWAWLVPFSLCSSLNLYI